MNLEEESLDQEKKKKWLKFLGGFLGWFIINTLIFALLHLPEVNSQRPYYGRDVYSLDWGILWLLVLLVNIIALTVLVTIKTTRIIALGVVSALAVNFAISMLFLTTTDAYCFVPVTYPVYSKQPTARPVDVIQVQPKNEPTNQDPIGFHDGNSGTVGSTQCTAFGWATDPDDRKSDLFVRVLSDGKEVAKKIASSYRPDLNVPDGCPGGTCGYEFKLGSLISADEEHFIQVQAQDAQTGEWISLNKSPKKLKCLK